MKDQMRRLTLTVCFLFLAELILGGPGYCWVFYGITLRKILFSGSLILLYTYVTLAGLWRFRLQDLLIFLFLFLSLAIWLIGVPYRNNIPLKFSFQDGGALLLLLIYFPLAQLIRSSKLDWNKVKSIFIFLVSIVCCIQVAVWITVYLYPELGLPIRQAALVVFDPLHVVKSDPSIFIGWMPDGFYRVMWITSLFLIPAFFFVIGKEKKAKSDFFLVVLFLGALYVSYTRALWLGMATGLSVYGLSIIIKKRRDIHIKVPYRNLLIIGVMILLVTSVTIFNIGNIMNNRLADRLLSVTVDESMQVRTDQVNSLLQKWSTVPILGTGFGGNAEYVRSEAAPYSYEMVAFALLMKLGMVGVALWGTTAILLVILCWRRARRIHETRWFYWWISMGVSYFSTAMTNPYFTNFIGISIMVMILLDTDHQLFGQKRLQNEA